MLDIQIIFETIKIILRKESTEGFTEEKGKEMHDGINVMKEETIRQKFIQEEK